MAASAAERPQTLDGDTIDSFPCMPCIPSPTKRSPDPHRRKIAPPVLPYVACVARPVGKAELEREEKAREARDKEWARLREKYVWDEEHPREWEDVRAKAKEMGQDVHLGYLFGICVEKNSEQAPENRKYKYRVVFQGNRVVDQNYDAA
eukprot:1140798-Lingulodinium_polyedra.AAC.1